MRASGSWGAAALVLVFGLLGLYVATSLAADAGLMHSLREGNPTV